MYFLLIHKQFQRSFLLFEYHALKTLNIKDGKPVDAYCIIIRQQNKCFKGMLLPNPSTYFFKYTQIKS